MSSQGLQRTTSPHSLHILTQAAAALQPFESSHANPNKFTYNNNHYVHETPAPPPSPVHFGFQGRRGEDHWVSEKRASEGVVGA